MCDEKIYILTVQICHCIAIYDKENQWGIAPTSTGTTGGACSYSQLVASLCMVPNQCGSQLVEDSKYCDYSNYIVEL